MITAQFRQACENNDVGQLRKLAPHTTIVASDTYEISMLMLDCAEKQHLDTVRYLLTSEDLTVHAASSIEFYKLYHIVAKYSDTSFLQYLLTDTELKKIQRMDYQLPYSPVYESAFNSACHSGNLNAVQCMMNLKELHTYHRDMKSSPSAFYHACQSGNIQLLDYFIKDPHFAWRSASTNASLNYAIENEKFDAFLFLLDNLFITLENLEQSLIHACQKGKLSFVQYLLNERHVNIDCLSNKPLSIAVDANQAHIVSYLLLSPQLTTHAQLDDNLFFNALKHIDTAQVCIVYANYTKPAKYKDFIFFSDFTPEHKKVLDSLFLMQELHHTLPVSSITKAKRTKI